MKPLFLFLVYFTDINKYESYFYIGQKSHTQTESIEN